VQSQHRDGLLGLVGLAALVGTIAIIGRLDVLVHPLGAGGGVVAAIGLEFLFVRYPSRALALWERRAVPVVSLCLVLVTAAVGFWFAPWLVAIPVWGLGTYLLLLCCVLLGVGNPVVALFRIE
jgi:hypothetical protein